MLLELLHELLQSPVFPETYVEKMRAQLVTGAGHAGAGYSRDGITDIR